MSVSFAPNKIDIPEGFASLVNELTMRILAEQPEDIIGFAAFYLRKKLQGTSKDQTDDVREGPIGEEAAQKFNDNNPGEETGAEQTEKATDREEQQAPENEPESSEVVDISSGKETAEPSEDNAEGPTKRDEEPSDVKEVEGNEVKPETTQPEPTSESTGAEKQSETVEKKPGDENQSEVAEKTGDEGQSDSAGKPESEGQTETSTTANEAAKEESG